MLFQAGSWRVVRGASIGTGNAPERLSRSALGSSKELGILLEAPVPAQLLRRLILLGAAVGFIAQLAYGSHYHFGPVDDAYIHLRIAHNFASGAGPVFNVGERVEVTSSPLWTLLLACALWLGMSGGAAVTTLALGSAALVGGAMAWLGSQLGGWRAAILSPLLLATLPGFAAWTGSGMETPLAAAGFIAATVSMLATSSIRGAVRTALLGGLLSYLRPELIACVPSLVGLAVLALPRRDWLRGFVLAGVAALVPLALLFLARRWYFGEWLPNTYYAKMSEGGVAQRLKGVGYVWHFVKLHPIYLGLAAVAFAKGSAPTRRVGLVFANFLLAVVWAGGDGFYYVRLALPGLPLAVAMCAAFLAALEPRRIQALAVVAALVVQVGWSFRAMGEFGRCMIGAIFAQECAEIGTFLRGLPKGMVATVGIGGIAYTSERPILDLVGLADKHIARAKRMKGAAIGHDHADNSYVLSRAPEMVLLNGWLSERALSAEDERDRLNLDPDFWAAALVLLNDPRFQASYTARDYLIGTQHLRLWLRNDLLAAASNSMRVP